MGGLKQQQFILSQCCRLEVQNRGVGRALLSLKVLEKRPSLPLSSFCCWPVSDGLPWLSAASLQASTFVVTRSLPCVSSRLTQTPVTLD